MDEFDCLSILEELGLVEKKVQLEYDVCCGVKMESIGNMLYCDKCTRTMNSKESEDSDVYSGVFTCKIGNKEYTCFGAHPKNRNERIADMVKAFAEQMNSKGIRIDQSIINEVCDTMYDITSVQIKKSSNRSSLFLALLHHISVRNDMILTPREVQKIMCDSNCKFSKGNKIIIQAVLDDILDRNKVSFGIELYDKLIIKYLMMYDPEFYLEDGNLSRRNINNTRNHKLCINMIQVMLEENIAFNSIIQTKCIAVVYYLIKEEYNYDQDEKAQKKYFTQLVGVGENTYIKVYNTLIRRDVQKIFINSGRFATC